ncbi:hypothetical protein [Candidatus Pantoea persica]|uniref:hypothetical protein n=1 Tax=Candidatus Pantoea persica TaxID=2518128 RepID=UPI0028682ACB|nr:hypothetical protein [Candidatus Pantoea persica]
MLHNAVIGAVTIEQPGYLCKGGCIVFSSSCKAAPQASAPRNRVFHFFVGQAKEEAHGDAGIAFNPIDFMIKSGIKHIDVAAARRELADFALRHHASLVAQLARRLEALILRQPFLIENPQRAASAPAPRQSRRAPESFCT